MYQSLSLDFILVINKPVTEKSLPDSTLVGCIESKASKSDVICFDLVPVFQKGQFHSL